MRCARTTTVSCPHTVRYERPPGGGAVSAAEVADADIDTYFGPSSSTARQRRCGGREGTLAIEYNSEALRSYLVFVACPATFRNNGGHLGPPPLPTIFVGSVGYVLRDGVPASGWVGFGILCMMK